MTTTEFDPIIGREPDLARLSDLLATERLVTITGPGGVGKSRLARAAIERAAATQRIAIVEAGHLRDGATMPVAVAAALGLRGSSAADERDAIARAVAIEPALLLLDELERIPEAGAAIVDLLHRAAGLRILATSRVPLGVSGEVVVPIRGLDLPIDADPANVATSPAVVLFVARSRGVGSTLGVDDENAAAIDRLVRRLDGLPLAIELAAARVRVLSPADIEGRIAERGPAAIDPADPASPSLRAAIDWSLGLLTAAERSTLETASVCAGSDLALLEAIQTEGDVAADVAGLIRSGLLRDLPGGAETRRFDLLETVRDAVRRPMDTMRSGRLRDAHAAAMLDRATGLESRAATEPALVIAAFERDADNVRMALVRYAEVDPDAGYALFAASVRLWRSGFRSSEGARAYETLAERSLADTYARSRALNLYSTIVWETDGTEVGRLAMLDSIDLAERVGDVQTVVHGIAGMLAMAMGDADPAAVAPWRDALDRVAPSAQRDPAALASLADARWAAIAIESGAESDAGIAAAVEAATVAHGVSVVREMTALANVALGLVLRGSFDAAIEPATQAARLAGELRHDTLAGFLAMLAEAQAHSGRLDAAEQTLGAAIDSVAADRPWDVDFVAVLRAATAVLVLTGRVGAAARTAGAFLAIADARPDLPIADDRRLLDRSLAMIRRDLSSVELTSAKRAGAGDDPIRLLLAVKGSLATEAADQPVAPAGRRRLRHGELTPREVQVLALIGLGRSDAEIADALSISAKTASVHVANIKGKFGLENRVEVALRARDLGLA